MSEQEFDDLEQMDKLSNIIIKAAKRRHLFIWIAIYNLFESAEGTNEWADFIQEIYDEIQSW